MRYSTWFCGAKLHYNVHSLIGAGFFFLLQQQAAKLQLQTLKYFTVNCNYTNSNSIIISCTSMLLILANGLVYYSLVHVMLFLAENYTVTHVVTFT